MQLHILSIVELLNNYTLLMFLTGQNMLFCSMIGPAGAPPVDEVSVKHHSRNVYHVSYTAKHKGKYHLFVKYGDQNIPGSPFNVSVN